MTRLSPHLPHLHRLCRLDRLSVRSKRLAAVLAAVLLTLSLVTLPLFAAAEQNHACARNTVPSVPSTSSCARAPEPLRPRQRNLRHCPVPGGQRSLSCPTGAGLPCRR